MKIALAVNAALALLGLGVTARASITIDTVTVDNPGNAADTRYATPGYGSVGYTYNIGRYEVTAGQYTAFLNAVGGVDTYALYRTEMGSTEYGSGITRSGGGMVGNLYTYSADSAFVNRPVNFVSYWDACRFANWLHNGQPTGSQGAGTTETGAYTLNGYNGYDGRNIQRNADWQWAIASENEWYKAAYHKNDGVTGNFWDFPTSSNAKPGRDLGDASGNNANYYILGSTYPIQWPYYTTVGGAFQNSDSPYGTFDQGGNLKEWNETITQIPGRTHRGIRGGCFSDYDTDLQASYRSFDADPTFEVSTLGFRVVQVPEPTTMAIMALGAIAILLRQRELGR